jgi:putative methionine-R-sulfoxide reductase with GAF domain
MLGTYHLTVLYDILKDLHFLHEPDKIYPFVVEHLMKAVDADAASLFVSDAGRKNLILKVCTGGKKEIFKMIAEEVPFPFGQGVCGWVAQNNQPVVIEDSAKDPRFSARADVLTGYKTRSMLCVPLSKQNEVLGVIQILNKKTSVFNKNDLDLVSLVARQTAISLENARLYSEMEAARSFGECLLSNMPSGFIAVDLEGSITYMNLGSERILYLAASDSVGRKASYVLRNYPPLAEALELALKDRQGQRHIETTCQRPDKSDMRVGYSTFPISDPSGAPRGAGISFLDLKPYKGKTFGS